MATHFGRAGARRPPEDRGIWRPAPPPGRRPDRKRTPNPCASVDRGWRPSIVARRQKKAGGGASKCSAWPRSGARSRAGSHAAPDVHVERRPRRHRSNRRSADGPARPGGHGSGACVRCARCSAAPRRRPLTRRSTSVRAGLPPPTTAMRIRDCGSRPIGASTLKRRRRPRHGRSPGTADGPRGRRSPRTSAVTAGKRPADNHQPATCPCRAGARCRRAAASPRRGSRASRPFSRVPYQLPAAGWTTRPAGLSAPARAGLRRPRRAAAPRRDRRGSPASATRLDRDRLPGAHLRAGVRTT